MAIEEIDNYLSKLLGPETDAIITAITSEPGTKESYFIEIPDPLAVDLHVDDLASLVVRTSNIYGRAARFAGMARAKWKLAEGHYKYKYKTSMKGNNTVEREQSGLEAAQVEFVELGVAEAMVEVAQAMENAARVASETARKLYDKAHTVNAAYRAETKGYQAKKDWKQEF